MSGYFIRESGPFTESNQHSQALTGAIEFRVGSPWGKTALVTGWGTNDQQFSPVHFEDYLTSSYVGIERRFGERLNVRAAVEDLRAWRVVETKSAIAQNLRPAGCKFQLPTPAAEVFTSTTPCKMAFLFRMRGRSAASSMTIPELLSCNTPFGSLQACKR